MFVVYLLQNGCPEFCLASILLGWGNVFGQKKIPGNPDKASSIEYLRKKLQKILKDGTIFSLHDNL